MKNHITFCRKLLANKQYKEVINYINCIDTDTYKDNKYYVAIIEGFVEHCNKRARGILDLRDLNCSIYYHDEVISEREMNKILKQPITRKRRTKKKESSNEI